MILLLDGSHFAILLTKSLPPAILAAGGDFVDKEIFVDGILEVMASELQPEAIQKLEAVLVTRRRTPHNRGPACGWKTEAAWPGCTAMAVRRG